MKKKNNRYHHLPEMVSPLLNWYDRHARILPWRENTHPYSVWVSEIMLQQTRVEAVKPYFQRWMAALPTVTALANASEEQVLKLWEGLGYYSRAKNLQKAANIIMAEHGGHFPSTFDELKSLPGIGEYTAGSIGSIAFRLPVPCVDGNVMRVITRITEEAADITLPATKKMVTEWVSQIVPKDRPGDFNQALMELGATVCLPNGLPKCEECPVAFLCRAYGNDSMTEFPVKAAKLPRKHEKRTILILTNGSSVALQKRPNTGLLAGLWEFPNFLGELSIDEVRSLLSLQKIDFKYIEKTKKSKHIFTHIEWDMLGYLVVTESPAEKIPYQWVAVDRLKGELALPSVFKAYLQILQQRIDTGFFQNLQNHLYER